MIRATIYWLVIVAGPHPDLAACEATARPDLAGSEIYYRCQAAIPHEGTTTAAPIRAPMPVPRPKGDE